MSSNLAMCFFSLSSAVMVLKEVATARLLVNPASQGVWYVDKLVEADS